MENNKLQTNQISHEIIESLIINGDLSKLQPKQKVEYYNKYCTALGLNPVTQPFALLKLNGKEKLYCGREGTAQLSKVHSVSHEILSTETINGVYIVKAKAITGTRFTTSTGAVNIENLKGDALCNALMKAETKAKRRATLDLLGLGMLDDTEIETIPNAQTIDISHTEVKQPSMIQSDKETVTDILNTSESLDDLVSNWKTLTTYQKNLPGINELKESLKAKFTNV